MEIRRFDSLESTNKYCKLLDPSTVEEFLVVVAKAQTAGEGQRGNVWVSEPGENLTFSIILKPSFLYAKDQYQLTMMTAVAVAESLGQTLTDKRVWIKWPNDIYVDDKKICGILTICNIVGNNISNAICGIGVNINQTQFPDWVPNPTSLQLLLGERIETEGMLSLILDRITKDYNLLKNDSEVILRRYMKRLYRLGIEADYMVRGERIRATITGVDSFGRLMLRDNCGMEHLCGMKEVTFGGQ